MPLSDAKLRALRPCGHPYELPNRDGLNLRVGATGVHIWTVTYTTTWDTTDDHLSTRAMPHAGLGCSLLTQGAFRHDLPLGAVEARPLRPQVFWTLALAEPDRGRNPASMAVAALLREAVHDMVWAREWPGGSQA